MRGGPDGPCQSLCNQRHVRETSAYVHLTNFRANWIDFHLFCAQKFLALIVFTLGCGTLPRGRQSADLLLECPISFPLLCVFSGLYNTREGRLSWQIPSTFISHDAGGYTHVTDIYTDTQIEAWKKVHIVFLPSASMPKDRTYSSNFGRWVTPPMPSSPRNRIHPYHSYLHRLCQCLIRIRYLVP